jgi:hypothetical protein
MTDLDERFDRNIRLFGKEGQARLRAASVAAVGVGGLGTFVVLELALLGVGALYLIDDEELSKTNRNRYVGARHDDPIPGSPKVEVGARLVESIDPNVSVFPIKANLFSAESFAAIRQADYVFGCLDEDGPRLVLNELCAAYTKPFFDLASDVPEPGVYGGRVCVAWDGTSCPYCLGEIDAKAAAHFLESDATRENVAAIYGIERAALGETGPSVASINGVVASLGATEFMAAVTGMRVPIRLATYKGHESIVTRRKDAPPPDCYYCHSVRGQGAAADVERYLRMPHLTRRRT